MTPLLDLAAVVAEHDQVAALNEASVLAIAAGDTPRVQSVVTDDTGPIALAYAPGDAPIELLVHPEHRRRGLGRRLADELLADGETRFWAHGDLPAARTLTERLGLAPARVLLVLRRTLDERPANAGRAVPYRPEHLDGLLRVNARAFAAHAEQGSMDRADFERRAASVGTDGLFVVEADGEVAGFHWTKIDGEVGEVYVMAVDPGHHGAGHGGDLLRRGLAHLWDRGIRTVDLYVEGDNTAALALYARGGFTEHARDVLYAAAPIVSAPHPHQPPEESRR